MSKHESLLLPKDYHQQGTDFIKKQNKTKQCSCCMINHNQLGCMCSNKKNLTAQAADFTNTPISCLRLDKAGTTYKEFKIGVYYGPLKKKNGTLIAYNRNNPNEKTFSSTSPLDCQLGYGIVCGYPPWWERPQE